MKAAPATIVCVAEPMPRTLPVALGPSYSVAVKVVLPAGAVIGMTQLRVPPAVVQRLDDALTSATTGLATPLTAIDTDAVEGERKRGATLRERARAANANEIFPELAAAGGGAAPGEPPPPPQAVSADTKTQTPIRTERTRPHFPCGAAFPPFGYCVWEMERRDAPTKYGSVTSSRLVLTLNRIVPYVAVWIAIVFVVALTPLATVWHRADYWILQSALHLGSGLTLDRDLSVVDLDVDDGASVATLRSREIALVDAIDGASGLAPLAAMGTDPCSRQARHLGARATDAAGAAEPPAAIVFDIAFESAASRLEPRCVEPLVRVLRAARSLGVKLYAAQDLQSQNGGGSITGQFQLDPDFERNQDSRVYAQLSESGHTLFTSDPALPGGPLFYYPKLVRIPQTNPGGRA